jgi:hypothetical protein
MTQTYPTVIPVERRAEGALIRELEPDWVLMLVQTLAVKGEGRETLESLWQHVDEGAFSDASRELWAKNGLRIGVAREQFVTQAKDALADMGDVIPKSYCFQKPRGLPFIIDIPWQQEGEEVLIFTEEGRTEAHGQYLQVHLLPDAIEEAALHISITPYVFTQEASTSELKGLAGEVQCRSFDAIVLGPSSYDETLCGSAFMFTGDDGSKGEFIIILYPVFVIDET